MPVTEPVDIESKTHINEVEIRHKKRADLESSDNLPYKYTFQKTHHLGVINEKYEHLTREEEPPTEIFSVAGRLMSRRSHGKAVFGDLQDQSGTLQFYANLNGVGDAQFDALSQLDIGDIIGLTGTLFCTKRGELSLKIQTVELLSKSLHPLPEKHHGLQDIELRYRQRYVDLIVNPSVRDVFSTRSKIVSLIRQFLEKDDFMEVETPVLQSIYGGAAARPFMTHHNELGQDLYLRIALELPLKRLIVGGFERIFEIGRVFRNEGVSYKHNPEYTLLELYQAYADYETMMRLTETLLRHLVQSIHGESYLTFKGQKIDFSQPFKRLTLQDAIQDHANVDITGPMDDLRNKATELGMDVTSETMRGSLINFIYDKTVEPHLIQPTFMMDYPWETSPLAKKHRSKPGFVERFELIISGMEIANAFSELNDPIDQRARFEDQLKAKEAGDDEAHMMDEDYIQALSYGMPPTGGLGIGIDRIVMLLTDQHSIRDVLFFPHMKTRV